MGPTSFTLLPEVFTGFSLYIINFARRISKSAKGGTGIVPHPIFHVNSNPAAIKKSIEWRLQVLIASSTEVNLAPSRPE